jgi:hypothetical protein
MNVFGKLAEVPDEQRKGRVICRVNGVGDGVEASVSATPQSQNISRTPLITSVQSVEVERSFAGEFEFVVVAYQDGWTAGGVMQGVDLVV